MLSCQKPPSHALRLGVWQPVQPSFSAMLTAPEIHHDCSRLAHRPSGDLVYACSGTATHHVAFPRTGCAMALKQLPMAPLLWMTS